MPLSPEDEFRLQILLAAEPQAIRIDESTMTVHILDVEHRERVVSLHPNCRDERYLRSVRNILAEKYSPAGGYPTQLNRWSAMGQMRVSNVRKLLLLGKPEAITAVATSPQLTNDVAALAWWALPTSTNARHLLAHQAVISGTCGIDLVDHLIEYLPFESKPRDIASTVKIVLASGLISRKQREQWWGEAQRRSAFMLGFLQAVPDDLPVTPHPPPSQQTRDQRLREVVNIDNLYAKKLDLVLSAVGQRYIDCCRVALKHLEDQEITVSLLDTIADYFKDLRPGSVRSGSMEETQNRVKQWLQNAAENDQVAEELVRFAPHLSIQLNAMMSLSLLSFDTLRPELANTTATGALMRRKLTGVVNQIDRALAVLVRETV